MRNDSILYTGQTSASRRAEKAELKKREKAEQLTKITPSEQVVFEFLDKERDETIKTLLGMVNLSTPEADVKSLLVSLNLYRQSIASVKNRLSSVLRRSNSGVEVTNE